MLNIQSLVFNPFQENTYIIWDDKSKEAAIIDPGCFNTSEQNELCSFIDQMGLKPALLLNTHAHIDHILGNAFVKSRFDIPLHLNQKDLPVLHSLSNVAMMYGVPATPSPEPDIYLDDGHTFTIGHYGFSVLFVPGHSPGSLAFYQPEHKFLISGDVLFHQSIGRTDLPGGDYAVLMNSIQNKLLHLPKDTIVYSGHGQTTTIGYEQKNNPFILEYLRT
jgi:glyoxylase-like metal-dependent hydrolase (beta-lactamase superfamily II)